MAPPPVRAAPDATLRYLSDMRVHLIDGTYELFRHFYALPSHAGEDGTDVAALRGVLGSVLSLLESGATHVGVATDHVIESFRNELWPGYKTGEGIDPALRAQFEPLEQALAAMGVAVWPMVELEADDALASAAAVAAADHRVEQVLICTPDKDLAQCVRDARVVQVDRRRNVVRDEMGVIDKYGVPPASIPDLLALVGDAADGFPGIPGWGARSAAAILTRYGRIEDVPDDPKSWQVSLRGAERLAASLAVNRKAAMLFKDLATLRTTADVGAVDDWRWRGPTKAFPEACARLRSDIVARRAENVAARLGLV
ncbi:MAG: 5'-3' exonuclease H3TH domain-containing protein [Thermodesulfobacteriota bacterium]